jgi:hypothetical protein
MKSLVLLLLAIAVLVGSPALAQRNPATASSPPAVREVHRDVALEQAAIARTRRLVALLQPEAKAKLDLASRALLAHLASGPENAHPYAFAQQEVHSRFPHVSSEQSNLLSFYVMAEVARILANPEELKNKLEDMNEMSKENQLAVQRATDMRKNMMETFQKIMKEMSATQDTLVKNLRE